MKQIEVSIMGQTYVLGCPEGGEADLLSAVNIVDREMCTIRDAGRVKARERVAVLAALNLAYGLEQRAAPAAAITSLAVSPPSSTAGVDSAALEALVRRVDQALGDDGRLI